NQAIPYTLCFADTQEMVRSTRIHGFGQFRHILRHQSAVRFPEHNHVHRLSYFHRTWLGPGVLQLQSGTPLPNIPRRGSRLKSLSPFFLHKNVQAADPLDHRVFLLPFFMDGIHLSQRSNNWKVKMALPTISFSRETSTSTLADFRLMSRIWGLTNTK